MSILVEVFSAPACRQCAHAAEQLQTVLAEWPQAHIEWRMVNIIEELDYSVSVGVLTTPAIAIDGKLVFSALPSQKKLRQTLQQYSEAKTSIK